MSATVTEPRSANGRDAVPVFGTWPFEQPPYAIPCHRVRAIATVAVERTPMFRTVGPPEPMDWDELVPKDDLISVDHDPAKYAPYTDLCRDGEDTGFGYGPYFLVEIR